jgi:hypothetical protein
VPLLRTVRTVGEASRATKRSARDDPIGDGHTDEASALHIPRVRACVRACVTSVQNAACNMRQTACGHTPCDMQRTTRSIKTAAIPCVAMMLDPRRAASCSGEATRGRHQQVTLPMQRKTFPQQCRGVCGALARLGFERKRTNARPHTMSTWPNVDVLQCKHSHHHADRRARRGDAPRPLPDVAARPATPTPTVG